MGCVPQTEVDALAFQLQFQTVPVKYAVCGAVCGRGLGLGG